MQWHVPIDKLLSLLVLFTHNTLFRRHGDADESILAFAGVFERLLMAHRAPRLVLFVVWLMVNSP